MADTDKEKNGAVTKQEESMTSGENKVSQADAPAKKAATKKATSKKSAGGKKPETKAEGGSKAVKGSQTKAEGGSKAVKGSQMKAEGGSKAVKGSQTKAEGGSKAVKGSQTKAEGGSKAVKGSQTKAEGGSKVGDKPKAETGTGKKKSAKKKPAATKAVDKITTENPAQTTERTAAETEQHSVTVSELLKDIELSQTKKSESRAAVAILPEPKSASDEEAVEDSETVEKPEKSDEGETGSEAAAFAAVVDEQVSAAETPAVPEQKPASDEEAVEDSETVEKPEKSDEGETGSEAAAFAAVVDEQVSAAETPAVPEPKPASDEEAVEDSETVEKPEKSDEGETGSEAAAFAAVVDEQVSAAETPAAPAPAAETPVAPEPAAEIPAAPAPAAEPPAMPEPKKKHPLRRALIVILIILLLGGAAYGGWRVVDYYRHLPPAVISVTADEKNVNEDNTVTVSVEAVKNSRLTGADALWCYFGEKDDPSLVDEAEWIPFENGRVNVNTGTGTFYIFVRDDFGNIGGGNATNVEVNIILGISVKEYDSYITAGVHRQLATELMQLGHNDETLTWTSSDPAVATVDEAGLVTGVATGECTITVTTANGLTATADFNVSELLTAPQLISGKTNIPAYYYTEEQADLLDRILASRISTAGYGTRAGVVAAARFMPLELPFKIPYFYENGRIDHHPGRPYCDGEGRYYHQGLYLSAKKFADLEVSTAWGPAIWGEPLMNWQEEGAWHRGVQYPNGLCCSGFISWALLNGGVPLGDVGAGDYPEFDDDLCDYGEQVEMTYDFMRNGNYQVGDLIGRDGHIALIVGLDEENIYIAESLAPGVVIAVHGRYEEVVDCGNYTYIMLMDEIYNEHNGQGNVTEMWEDYSGGSYTYEEQ